MRISQLLNLSLSGAAIHCVGNRNGILDDGPPRWFTMSAARVSQSTQLGIDVFNLDSVTGGPFLCQQCFFTSCLAFHFKIHQYFRIITETRFDNCIRR